MTLINLPSYLKRKHWLFILLLTILSFIALAAMYKNFIHQEVLSKLKSEMNIAARVQVRILENELQKFSLLPLVLSENPDVHAALTTKQTPDSSEILNLNEKLALLATRTEAPYIYVIDQFGTTVASSNYNQEDSFVGRQYEFRPYFQLAMQNGDSEYFAKGERTGKSGLFFARRIDDNEQSLGVIVVKVEFEDITNLWKESNSTTFVTNSDKIILFSSDDSLNYSTLEPLSEQRRRQIQTTKQFGNEPLSQTSLSIGNDFIGVDQYGNNILTEILKMPDTNWQIYRTVQVSPVLKVADSRIQLHLLSAATLIIGLGAFIAWRTSLQLQRAQTTQYLETEVKRQTQELTNANSQLEHEIDQREKINKRFRNAREELAQANRLGSIGAITTSVAHEINQPVAAIHAFAENTTKLLNRNEFERAKENQESIVELTSKIGAITTELRRYARRGSQSIGRVLITDIIDGVELLIGERIRTANIQFNILIPDTTPLYVKAGRVRLEQVLVNLLQNASEALENVPEAVIDMVVHNDKKNVYITISDNGSGIDKGIESEIFNPFFTTKSSGLGIGLGIAKDILSDFDASITVAQSVLGGATFKLKLETA